MYDIQNNTVSVVTYFYVVQVYELTSCFCFYQKKTVNTYLLVFTDI